MILGAVKKLYDVSPQNRIVPRASIFPKDNEYENLTVINFTNIYFTQIQNLPNGYYTNTYYFRGGFAVTVWL